MSDVNGRNKRTDRTDKHVDVEWNTPTTRAQPVFRHEVDCQHCGRHFVVEESLQPVAPKYCLEDDNPECFRQRRAAYMRRYRAGKKGEDK